MAINLLANDQSSSQPINLLADDSSMQQNPVVSSITQQADQQAIPPEQMNNGWTPKSAAKNVFAGLLDTGANALKMLPNVTGIYPKGQAPIDKFDAYKAMGTTNEPYDTMAGAQQVAGGFLLPGMKFAEEIPGVQKGGQLISNALGGLNNKLNPLQNVFSKLAPEDIAKTVQQNHDAMKTSASDLFNNVADQAKARGINTIPVDKNVIDNIAAYLPKTRAVQSLMDKANSGDYASVRKLQSELWNRGTKKTSSVLSSDKDAGEEMLDLRDKVNEGISKHFKDTGNEDLGNTLDQARSQWANLKNTYYSHPTIAKLVDPNIRKIPKNIANVFSENSVPMERVRQSNPSIVPGMQEIANKQNAMKNLSYLKPSGPTLGAIGAAALANPVYHMLKNIFSSPQGNQ